MWKQRTGDLENRWRSVDVEYSGMKEDERLVSVTPSQRQIAYQNMEYFCYIHFTVITFTGCYWGVGDEL